jgi:hypothetical protein
LVYSGGWLLKQVSAVDGQDVQTKIGERLSGHIRLPSVAGRGLTERMRTTTFALLGITAAAGLGLVAIFSQQGWPLLPSSPLPTPPAAAVAVEEARAIDAHHLATLTAVNGAQSGHRPDVAPAPRRQSGDLAGQLPVGLPEPAGTVEPQAPKPPESQPAPAAQKPEPATAPAPSLAAAPQAAAPPAPAPTVVTPPSKPSKASVEPPKGNGHPDKPPKDEVTYEPAGEVPQSSEPNGHAYGHGKGQGSPQDEDD